MAPLFFTLPQLALASGRATQTVRKHVRRGWLRQTPVPGARGLRVVAAEARRWLGSLFPEVPLTVLDQPLKARAGGAAAAAAPPPPEVVFAPHAASSPPVWCRSLHHDWEHLVQPDGGSLCGAKVPLGGRWVEVPPGDSRRRCKRCLGRA